MCMSEEPLLSHNTQVQRAGEQTPGLMKWETRGRCWLNQLIIREYTRKAIAGIRLSIIFKPKTKSVPVHWFRPQGKSATTSWGYEDGPSKGPGPRSAGGRWFVRSKKERIRRYRRHVYEAGALNRTEKMPAQVIDAKKGNGVKAWIVNNKVNFTLQASCVRGSAALIIYINVWKQSVMELKSYI